MRPSRIIGPVAGVILATSIAAEGAQIFFVVTNSNVRFLNGSFQYAYAGVYDSIAGEDHENNTTGAAYPGGVATRHVQKVGNAFAPEAQVKGVTTGPGGGTLYGSGWGTFGVGYLPGVGNLSICQLNPTGLALGWETARAQISWVDPMTFSVTPGAPLWLGSTPCDGLDPTLPNGVASSSYSITNYVNTDIPGFASLYTLIVNMSSATPGQVVVSFTSNPLLGLNDAAITANLESGFSYDPATGNYSFNSTGQEIDMPLDVPADVTSATFTIGEGEEGDGTVPEPSAFAMFSLGSLSLLACKRRRQKAKA